MSAAEHAEVMRAWARGSYTYEAGVELLIRSGLAQRHHLAAAWRTGGLDHDALAQAGGPLSGGERRILAIAVSLLCGGGDTAAVVDLAEVLPGLDRASLELVLAAIAHGAGSHEHGDTVVTADGWPVSLGYLPPAHPWPALDQDTTS